jgi:hypothetical protein
VSSSTGRDRERNPVRKNSKISKKKERKVLYGYFSPIVYFILQYFRGILMIALEFF